jgi:ubiquinone/menaquinone biosynthesis C-methylase UbiE
MKEIIDNFSSGAQNYAAFRPESPAAIFDFLYSLVHAFNTAWDCGTGNGQVALKLAERFKLVYGTDISEEQLNLAPRKDNILYHKERAEQTTLPAKSIDLITVAQAIHWFDFDPFYAEVNRVAKPGAIIAVWTYTNLKLTAEINEVLDHFYNNITHAYWNKERRYVDGAYQTIPFPFQEIPTPVFSITRHMTMEQVLGYLGTWSGVRNYIRQEGKDPIELIRDDIKKAWGDTHLKEVHWPVHMRAGRVAG